MECTTHASIKVYAALVHTGDYNALRTTVQRLEALGVAGVLVGDHLFFRTGEPAADPYTTLAAAGMASNRMELGTLVANVGLAHPAVSLRHFAQLAGLFGGERVIAGIGAGWNREEFEALGQDMPPLPERLRHLEGSARLARSWFDNGTANLATDTFTASNLPMSPVAAKPPQLMLGGGSTSLLEIAGRYADRVDLHPLQSRRDARRAGGTDEFARFLGTTMEDARCAVQVLEESERQAGRRVGTTLRSMWMGLVTLCSPDQRRAAETELCALHGLAWRDLSECPYALVGDSAYVADLLVRRHVELGLDAVVMSPGEELEQFMTEVYPLVRSQLARGTDPVTPHGLPDTTNHQELAQNEGVVTNE